MLAAFVIAVLVALGLWQLDRLQWKEALLTRIEARAKAPPQDLPPQDAWPALVPDDYDYRHVRLRGTFEHAGEILVFRGAPTEGGGVGSLVLTPFRLADGSHVVVNRGFVPVERRDPATRAAAQTGGEVNLTGLMRPPEARNPFTPADDPARNLWFTRDPTAIAAARGLEKAAPFTIDTDAVPPNPGGWPQGGATVVDIPNNHLSYALTWFGLALGGLATFAAFAWTRLRGA